MSLKPVFAAFVFMAMAACGGGGGGAGDTAPMPADPNLVLPAELRTVNTSATGTVTVVYDSASDEITKNMSGSPSRTIGRAVDQSIFASGDFTLYEATFVEALPGGGSSFTRTTRMGGLRAVTPSGNGQAVILSGFGNYSAVSRLSDTTMPTTGTAGYTGDYAAFFNGIRGDKESSFITGRVSLDADFQNGVIRGMVTDRVDNAGDSFANVTLGDATIVGGAFSGPVTGGEILTEGKTVTNIRTYDGLFVGPNGEEIVGGVLVRHVNAAEEFGDEFGLFVLNNEPE